MAEVVTERFMDPSVSRACTCHVSAIIATTEVGEILLIPEVHDLILQQQILLQRGSHTNCEMPTAMGRLAYDGRHSIVHRRAG